MSAGACTTRAAIVDAALAWLDTPYHWHARIKGVGVDCAQILLAVFVDELALAPALNVGLYPQQWHLHRGEEIYLQWLRAAGARQVDAPQPGDIAMYRFGRTYSHAAICVGDGEMLHAYYQTGVIVSRSTEAPLAGRAVQYWSIV